MVDTDIETWTTEDWIYVGRRWGMRESKVYHVFKPISDSSDEKWFSKGPKNPIVGGVYDIKTKDDSAVVRTAEYVRKSEDQGLVDEWRLLDRSAVTKQEALRATKRLAGENGSIGDLTLDDIHKVIHRQPRHMQAGTIAVVLQYLGAA